MRNWYRPIACWLIQAASVSGGIALVFIGIAYRQRVIPLAWTWVRTSRGHSRTSLQIALLTYVRSLLPVGVSVSLVGDCEFGHRPILLTVQEWSWDYVLRQSGHQLVDVASESDWRFVGDVFLTASQQVPTHLLLAWERH